jgi:hypothetical protein
VDGFTTSLWRETRLHKRDNAPPSFSLGHIKEDTKEGWGHFQQDKVMISFLIIKGSL